MILGRSAAGPPLITTETIMTPIPTDAAGERDAPLEMSPEEFRAAGHDLVDRVADFLGRMPAGPVTPGESPPAVRAALGGGSLPERGAPADALLAEAAPFLFDHSLFNGHPRFWGYITSSAAPLGALGDLLAAAVNPNAGAWILSPAATEIESQTIRWIAELIGYPAGCGGVLVSGGNMANFVAFLAARRAQATWDIRARGLGGAPGAPVVYASRETHTWIQKAADLFGMGTDAIRWIPADGSQRMDTAALETAIVEDRGSGRFPFLVVGAAGTVSTGAVDPIREIAAVCRRHRLWFHVDGAYGAPAAALPEAPSDLHALAEADSLALDPHKWLYAPLEAGCTLVREPSRLLDAFSFHPEYYNFGGLAGEAPVNYFEFGPQNSRGFRALKVWLGLRRAGREGYVRMIRDDIAVAAAIHAAAAAHPELEAATLALSIATFRYVPPGLDLEGEPREAYLNELNQDVLNRLQAGGEAFISNAVVEGRYLLRACVVNFRSTLRDAQALAEIVVRVGRRAHAERKGTGVGGG
jgi:aromatic-L-amino-acid decarboxylase